MTQTKEQVVAMLETLATTAEKESVVEKFIAEALAEDATLDADALRAELLPAPEASVGDDAESLFAQFAVKQVDANAKDEYKDAVERLKADKKHCVCFQNLLVGNVSVTPKDNYVYVALTVDKQIYGMYTDPDKKDALGMPVTGIGPSHIVNTTNYALGGLAKRSPKTALLGTQLGSDEIDDVRRSVENLFIGAKIDIICQFVEANTEYRNPFSRNAEPTTWAENKVIHHVIAIKPGENQDMAYAARFK